MKRFTIILLFNLIFTNIVFGQCDANYSFSGNTDTLTFSNQSIISNAHFYWNFGDGSGSNDISPVHVFPDDGKYLVTLYGVDTVTNCVDVTENWIDVIKPDTFACNIFFTDTIIGNTPQTTNLSTNCSGYDLDCHVFANAQNVCNGFSMSGWGSSLWLHGMQATDHDSIYGSRIFHAYYETLPQNYTSSTNYQNCSANFELVIDYQANGAMVTVTAMNKSGNSTFSIIGFGSTINFTGVTASYLYPYITYTRVKPWLIRHIKTGNGCASVSSTQTVLIRNPYYTWPANCVISQQPQTQFLIFGTTAQFIIDAPSNVTKQWQQNAGLGFVNLSNAGPYSGVNSDTLSISNVQLTMNNFQYRCILSDSSGNGCYNTSDAVNLFVSTTGINEINNIDWIIYPNPVSEVLYISGPFNMKSAAVTIKNVLGQIVYLSQFYSEKGVDVSYLNNGIYNIELKNNNVIGRYTFIKN